MRLLLCSAFDSVQMKERNTQEADAPTDPKDKKQSPFFPFLTFGGDFGDAF